MFSIAGITAFLGFLQVVAALRWSEQYVGFNLNENQHAQNPLNYSGVWENHTYHPSPQNWRFPFYTVR
jgi:alpha-1,3-glucan synthase